MATASVQRGQRYGRQSLEARFQSQAAPSEMDYLNSHYGRSMSTNTILHHHKKIRRRFRYRSLHASTIGHQRVYPFLQSLVVGQNGAQPVT
jgi:hypothetical protein